MKLKLKNKTSNFKSGLNKLWKKQRTIGASNFAGLGKLKPFEDGRQLTNSARSTFLTCRKKYQFSYVYGLASRKTFVPFLVGGLFHEELDIMYTKGKFNKNAAKIRISSSCKKAALGPGITSNDSNNISMQQATILGMVNGYAAKYLKDDLKRWKIIEAEGSFKTRINDQWTYRGKTDLIVLDIKTKQRLLVEHKTAAQITASYVAKLPLDNQIIGYAWAKKKQGLNIDGVVYNVTKKPGIRQKQNESLDEFYDRVEQEYIDNPGNYFYRETLTFGDRELKRFSNELLKFVDAIDEAHEKNYFYQNTGACTSMGVCPFMKLCVDGTTKENLMLYRIKEKAHEELDDDQN